jgi:hypothetical protein
MQLAPIDYLDALRLKDVAASITLGGHVLSVRRARLGLHYRLQVALGEIATKGQAPNAILAFLQLATGADPEALGATLAEALAAVDVLVALNALHGTLPILVATGAQAGRRSGEDYPNRALSSIVVRLAHAYGWPVDHILELGPEEAICYLQEAVVIRHEEDEFQWSIAGGVFDAKGKRQRFPPLRWAPPPGPRRKAPPLPARLQPQGIIVRGSDFIAKE